ncbi:MAG: hypothetical protein NC080_01525 [Paraprevotella sp.]|nr:hypothetical protein [Paraprevotella sp.]
MRNYSINWGGFLFFRWFPISWTLQAVHVLDKKEMLFRIILELIPVCLIASLAVFGMCPWWVVVLVVILIHTLFWLFNSTWLVGFREVYTGFCGKGVQSIIDFVDWSVKELKDCDNITAITIYGSICRHRYHDRSDFDLRIVEERTSLKTFFKMIKLRAVGIWRYKIPIDLKLVDSQEYLKKEMRADEHPIIAYNKYDTFYDMQGDSYAQLKANPDSYRKDRNV